MIFSQLMFRTINIKLALLFFPVILVSCAKNPVSGYDFVTITELQEIEMGRAYHKEILKNSKILKNKDLPLKPVNGYR